MTLWDNDSKLCAYDNLSSEYGYSYWHIAAYYHWLFFGPQS